MNIFGYIVPGIFIYFFVLLIVLIIYLSSEDETKSSIKRFVMANWMWILLIGMMIYGWNRWGLVADHETIANMKWALFLALSIGAVYLIATNWLFELKYHTVPFQANGVYGSCSRYYDVGKYTIFYLGTTGRSLYSGFMINWNFAERICIVPKVSWDFNGEGIVSIAQVSKYMLEQLPSYKVKRSIENDSLTWFARDEIYYGEFSEALRTEDPSVDEIESRITDGALLETLQKNMIEGKNTIIKKHITDTEAMKNKLKGNTVYRERPQSNEES
jgi:hypothetical protein